MGIIPVGWNLQQRRWPRLAQLCQQRNGQGARATAHLRKCEPWKSFVGDQIAFCADATDVCDPRPVVKKLPHGHAPAKKVGGKIVVPRARKVKAGNKNIRNFIVFCCKITYVLFLAWGQRMLGTSLSGSCCCSETSKRGKHVFEGPMHWVGQVPVAKPAFATRWTWPQVSGRGFFFWMGVESLKAQLVSETVFDDDEDHFVTNYEVFGIFDQA